MSKERKHELSYFRAALIHFLKEYHPHIANNKELTGMRVAAAEDLFFSQVHDGKDVYTANGMALQELFTGLEFSLYYLIHDLISENDKIPPTRRRTVSLYLLPLCNPILEKYQGTDFYEDEISYTLLQFEIKAVIKNYLKDNGIQ